MAIPSIADEQPSDRNTGRHSGGSTAADLLFFSAMALFGTAIAVAAIRHLGTSLTVAAAIGCAVFLLCVAFHLLVRRGQASQPDELSAKASRRAKPERGEAPVDGSRVAEPPAKSADAAKPLHPDADLALGEPGMDESGRGESASRELAAGADVGQSSGQLSAGRSIKPGKPFSPRGGQLLEERGRQEPEPVPARPATDGPKAGPDRDHSEKPAPTLAYRQPSDLASFWNLRPGGQDLPDLNWARSSSVAASGTSPKGTSASDFAAMAGAAGEPAAVKQQLTDAGAVNAILKRLASDISAGRARLLQESLRASGGDDATLSASGPSLYAAPAASEKSSADRWSDSSVARGDDAEFERLLVEALNSHDPESWTSESDRVPPRPDQSGYRVPPATPAPAAPMPDKVTALAAALAAEKVSVFLEPIRSLDRNAPQHYELTLRLRLGDGSEVARESYSAAASGTAVLPLIDTVALVHARRLVWRKMDSDPDGRLFTAVSGETVLSDQFSDDFDRMVARDGAFPKRIVLSLDQADVRLFTEAHLAALRQLSAAGIVFALDAVTDLDMDFDALMRAGFRFVKLDADVFLDGLPVDTARIPAEDICRHLSAAGLLAIVGHIRDRAQLEKLKECGVTMGKGPLFGSPQVMRAEVPSTN